MALFFTWIANRKIMVSVFAIVFLVLGGFYYYYEQKITSQTLSRVGDQLSATLAVQLEQESSNDLRYALILSQNSELNDALEQDNEDKGFEILSGVMQSFKLYTDALIRAQIITSDYVIFARSWDNSYAGMPLEFHRPDLLYFQSHKKPRAAIEVGRKVGVKATVPVNRKGQMLGFIEVVSFFETPQEYFESLGIGFYVLLNKQFYDIAVFMQDNPQIAKKYILANGHYTVEDVRMLNGIDFKALKQNRVVYVQGKYIFYEPMKNGEGEIIGAFVFSMTPKQIKLYRDFSEEELSFLIHFSRNDLYGALSKKNKENGIYQSIYDKELLYLKDTVAPEDREIFKEEAQERLNTYTKEELIGLILGYKIHKEIKGEIK